MSGINALILHKLGDNPKLLKAFEDMLNMNFFKSSDFFKTSLGKCYQQLTNRKIFQIMYHYVTNKKKKNQILKCTGRKGQ